MSTTIAFILKYFSSSWERTVDCLFGGHEGPEPHVHLAPQREELCCWPDLSQFLACDPCHRPHSLMDTAVWPQAKRTKEGTGAGKKGRQGKRLCECGWHRFRVSTGTFWGLCPLSVASRLVSTC